MVEIDCLVLNIGIEFEFCIDRYDIIVSAYLDAVTRVEHHRDIRIESPACEIAKFRSNLREAEISLNRHFVKASSFEEICYSRSVAWRVGQIGDGFISAIAND